MLANECRLMACWILYGMQSDEQTSLTAFFTIRLPGHAWRAVVGCAVSEIQQECTTSHGPHACSDRWPRHGSYPY